MPLSTTEYLDILKAQTESGATASMIITGRSMSPFLEHGRDTIYFEKPSRALRRGDMVFFQRDSGQYVMHRLCKIKNDMCYIIGDNQTEVEGPIPRGNIFAVVTKVKRKDRIIGPHNFWWFFFAHIWIHMIPLRRTVINCYRRYKSFLTRLLR